MKVIDNKALLLRVKNPKQLTTVIPKSRELDNNQVLVKWGVEETRVLRNLRIKAPSPITSQYNWPGKYKPFDHQRKTADFLTLNQRCFCFSEQGTGKTGAAIWAADYLMQQKIIKRVLIVCPLSIMDSAWRGDLFTFAMHRRVDVAHGTKQKRVAVINSNAEFVIINYDGLNSVFDEVAAGGFDLIIGDEGTYLKNPSTTRWKTFHGLLKPETWVWLMTGTPAAQSPVDAHGLARIVNPSGVPRSKMRFRDQVMHKVTQFKWVAKKDANETVHRVLQPAIRFTKDECLDLPELVYTTRDVEMTRQQKAYYNKLTSQMVFDADGESVTAHNAAIHLNKLLQISSGTVYSDEKETLEFDISSRYKVLREVIDESSAKVLVFIPFRAAIDVISDMLTKDKITSEKISGSVSASKRTEIFRNFQKTDNPRVLLIQPQAAAHGVTLTAANTVVWWGPTFSLETYAQANARVHRQGQVNHCTVVHLQGSPVERRAYKMLYEKVDIHSDLVSFYKEIVD